MTGGEEGRQYRSITVRVRAICPSPVADTVPLKQYCSPTGAEEMMSNSPPKVKRTVLCDVALQPQSDDELKAGFLFLQNRAVDDGEEE